MEERRIIDCRGGPAALRQAADEAARRLAAGGVIVYPTETLYGLGADASNGAAVERLYRIKGREWGKPLPVLFRSLAAAAEWVELGPEERALAARFWPGPLTLAAPLKPGASVFAAGGGATLGVRVSPHPFVARLLEEVPFPVVATSANLSGGAPPSSAEAALEQLGGLVDAVFDAGPLPPSRGSTVAAVKGGRATIIRAGELAPENIHSFLKETA